MELRYQLDQANDVIQQARHEEAKIRQEAEDAKAQYAASLSRESRLRQELDELRARYIDVEAVLSANELESQYKVCMCVYF